MIDKNKLDLRMFTLTLELRVLGITFPRVVYPTENMALTGCDAC